MKRTKQPKFFPKKPVPDTRPRQLCSICDTWVLSEQMSSHMRVIHIGPNKRKYKQSSHLGQAQQPSTNMQPSGPPQYPKTTCPDCGASVQVRRLDRHCSKIHGIPSNVQSDAQASASPAKPVQRPHLAPSPAVSARPPKPTRPPAKSVQRPPPQRQAAPGSTSTSYGRTGVFYDDELFSVEVEGKCIGTAGSAKEGWEMIEEYKRKL
jgi:hypothetical protein